MKYFDILVGIALAAFAGTAIALMLLAALFFTVDAFI